MKNHFSRVVDDQNSERLQQGSNLFVCVCVCVYFRAKCLLEVQVAPKNLIAICFWQICNLLKFDR